MHTSPTPQLRRPARLALLVGIAAAGLATLTGCDDETAVGATTVVTVATTTPHSVHPTPESTSPAITTPATTPATTPPATTPATTAATTPPVTAPDTAPDAAPFQIDVTTSDHAFTLSSEVAAAGPVTFALTNEGSEPHQMQVAALPDGMTAADFVEAFERDGELAALESVVWAGGVNGVEPGATEIATVEVAPGRYVVLCFIPSPGEHGTSHVSLGMVGELDVVDTGEIAPEPLPVATVELTDFAIAIPERFTGGVVEVINNGSQNHELILMRFDEGKSLADLVAWSQSGMPAERPFDYVGGTGTMAPGTRGWATLTLESGEYVALCVVQGPTEQPHVDLGMIAPFSVS